MKFSKNKKRIIIGCIFALLVLIIIPLIIHTLFSLPALNDYLEAKWTAGDFLQFYGAIISAVIAIIGIAITIWYTQKNYHDDMLKKVLPYICVEIAKEDTVKKISSDGDRYMSEVFFIVEQEEIIIKNRIDNIIEEYLRKCKMHDEKIPGGVAVVAPKNALLPLIIENTGNGTAVGLQMNMQSDTNESKYTIPINLKPSEKIHLNVIIADFKERKQDRYSLIYSYSDIYKTRYQQTQTITRELDGVMTTDLSFSQEKIPEKQDESK